MFDARSPAGNNDAGHFKESVVGLHKETSGGVQALLTSYSLAQACLAYGHNDLKQTFASVDCDPPPCTVSVGMGTSTG
jgi:mRNA interferase HigB